MSIDPIHPSRGIRVGDLALSVCTYTRTRHGFYAAAPEIVRVVRAFKRRDFHHAKFMVESLETGARRKKSDHELLVRSRDRYWVAGFSQVMGARGVQGHSRRWLFDKISGEALRVATLYDEWVVATMIPTRWFMLNEKDVFATYPKVREAVGQIRSRFSLVDGWDYVAQRRNRDRILATTAAQ